MKEHLANNKGAMQKIFTSTALSELRESDHPLGRPLALCLMFESLNDQLLAASVFKLAIALDGALHIPSDSLLAAIRIQWWANALAEKSHQNVPLIACLRSQCQTRYNLLPELQEMIGEWNMACWNEAAGSGAGWAAAWRVVAVHLGHRTVADQAATIGQDIHCAAHGYKYSGRADNINIKSLRRNDEKERRSWLYLSACLHRRLKRGLNFDLESARLNFHSRLDDPLLVWQILSWYFFGPPR